MAPKMDLLKIDDDDSKHKNISRCPKWITLYFNINWMINLVGSFKQRMDHTGSDVYFIPSYP